MSWDPFFSTHMVGAIIKGVMLLPRAAEEAKFQFSGGPAVVVMEVFLLLIRVLDAGGRR